MLRAKYLRRLSAVRRAADAHPGITLAQYQSWLRGIATGATVWDSTTLHW